jgi:arsenite-transporting ATPase
MTLIKLLENRELSFVFVGGKGGVGKTTSSSALACQMAFDRKVLLISTDPAHSLSDAFRQTFSGEPQKIPGVPNLDVMEVNPEKYLTAEVDTWTALALEAGMLENSDVVSKMEDFQSWLLGIPGVDEATALSSVIELIESGSYDVIVFDTAPTGHTLKLLQLPAVMQAGLEKLESWQTTMWNYWEVLKAGGKQNPASLKKKVAQRIRNYKHGIEKVGNMLKDATRTAFVVVCIAEYLSISETQRLLQELKKHKVNATHVIVNQLFMNVDVNVAQVSQIKALLEGEPELVKKIENSLALTGARGAIQKKYLNELKNFPEARNLEIVEVPLLPKEITGPEALLEISAFLVPDNYRANKFRPELLTERKAEAKMLYENTEPVFDEGDQVMIFGLQKSAHFNGLIAQVVNVTQDGRVSVRIPVGEKTKILSLRAESLKPHVANTQNFL